MLMETVSAAGGNIEIMFLRQRGDDPFISTPERTAQIGEVASRIARFISEARSTLDIAIYDFRLRDEAAAIISDSLRERAKNKVVIRIIYDATTEPDGDIVPATSPVRLQWCFRRVRSSPRCQKPSTGACRALVSMTVRKWIR